MSSWVPQAQFNQAIKNQLAPHTSLFITGEDWEFPDSQSKPHQFIRTGSGVASDTLSLILNCWKSEVLMGTSKFESRWCAITKLVTGGRGLTVLLMTTYFHLMLSVCLHKSA